MTRIAVIIVNHRTAALAVDCIASLAADPFARGSSRVLLVENASGDGSRETLRSAISTRQWYGWVTLYEATENRGFGAGNNLAIQSALHSSAGTAPDHLLLLNPDTLAHPDTARVMSEFLDGNPQVGIVGCSLVDRSGNSHCAAHNLPSVLAEFEESLSLGIVSRALHRPRVSQPAQSTSRECGWVSGAALMIRAATVRQIGLFDERFFLYFEEVDWCRRARKAGWKVCHLPAVAVTHLEGASTGVSRASLSPHWRNSRRHYFLKHHGRIGLLLADTARAIGRSGNLLSSAIKRVLTPPSHPQSDGATA